MSKVRFRKYVHSDKESNDELVEKYQDNGLVWLAYEVELYYEYDTETKETKLIGANEFFLSEESYASEQDHE